MIQKLRMLQSMLGPLQVFLLKTATFAEKVEFLLTWRDPWVRLCVCGAVCGE
jgi:hypothetical protein